MAILPTKSVPVIPPVEALEHRFQRLAATWVAETSHMSSTTDQMSHPALQEIVNMGEAVVSFLLRELEKRSGHWHRALKRITHADPTPPSDRGDIDKITEAWLSWGKDQGYKWK
jgi:hypothetical protein